MGDKIPWVIGLGAVVVAALLLFGDGLFMGPTTSTITGSSVGLQSSGEVKIPIEDISEDSKFYEYGSGASTIRFFAVKANDGSIKTGFDACDVCHDSGKGYRQEGDYMVCNNCGNKYPISGLGTENKNPGGCWPGFLPSTIQGNEIVIKNSDIESGQWRFV